ncbi:MAG TPA: hypothetical protein DHW64_02215, partial [Chitinophagaceae bacterium]|nr:hypothetical protein [Chitinophagaceae bacterium]
HYSVICRWLGAGLKFVTKSYINPTTGQNVVLKRVMEGWEPKKIVVIGRTQEQRVKFFANQLKNELGNDYTIVTFKPDPNWSSAETLLQNKNFIRFYKERGYAFYDIGLDDFFPLTGNDMQDYGPYYLMEIMEVFNGK